MKPLLTFAVFVFTSVILLSCVENKHDHPASITHETPIALQDDKMDLSSLKRSSEDLTEQLYAELVEQDPSLKKLEEELSAAKHKPHLLKEKFDQYDSKSLNYYASAMRNVEMITDSVLKQKIKALLTYSNERYLKKTSRINGLLNQISGNEQNLRDHHLALKIALTMPVIEHYQCNLVDEKPFQELIQAQESLLIQADKHLPEF